MAPKIVPGPTLNDISLAAYTRLSRDVGIDGGGEIARIRFKALKQKLVGTTISLHDLLLVDRNALEISKSPVNGGNCKVIISDTAPLYLPIIRK